MWTEILTDKLVNNVQDKFSIVADTIYIGTAIYLFQSKYWHFIQIF